MSKPNFVIKPASSPSELTAARSLFTEYVQGLGIDLSFQNFASELAALPGVYAEPEGIILLAFSEAGQAIGCVALRQLKSNNGRSICEMKRLYCSEEARGMGVGKALAEEVIRRAKETGYEEMRLDTLPRMEAARRMYAHFGFAEIEAYYKTPLEGTIFMCKKLR